MTNLFDMSQFPGLAHLTREPDDEISPRIADLAASFPLLFYMLATDTGPFSRRLEVIRLAEQGQPLAELATAYRLPLCMRRIQPQACIARLPWFGWSNRAAPILGNHIPQSPEHAATWLNVVWHAARTCHEDFALWVARQDALSTQAIDCRLLQPLALYAWHSSQPENALTCITVTPWSPAFGLSRTLVETSLWLDRLHVLTTCGSYPIADTWIQPGRVGSYEFVPITTLEALSAERAAMRNCLHTYVDKLAVGTCRLFAVKQNKRSLATLEIAPRGREGYAMTQLKGPGNAKASQDIEIAADTWLQAENQRYASASPLARTHHGRPRLALRLSPYEQAIRQPIIASIDGTEVTVPVLKGQLDQLQYQLAKRSRPSRPRPPSANARSGAVATPRQRSVEEQRVHDALRAQLGADVYLSWFRSMEFEGCQDGVVRATVPLRFLHTWITNHFVEVLNACCALAWRNVVRVEVSIRSPAPNVHVPEAAFTPDPVAQNLPPVPGGSTPISVSDILTAVARYYRVTRADLLSPRRHPSIVRPRQIGMYLARELCAVGHAQIGRRFGDRDAATVLHAVRKIDQLLEDDQRTQDEVEALHRALTQRRD